MKTMVPLYEDALSNELYGKSRLPIFMMEKYMTRDYPLHHHNFAELSLVLEGSGTEIVNGFPHRFKRGTVTILLPHHVHEVRLEDPRIHKINCMFDIQLIFSNPTERALVCNFLTMGKHLPSHYDLDEEQTLYLQRLLTTMREEYESEYYAKDTILLAKLFEALVFIIRTKNPAERQTSTAINIQNNIKDLLYYLHLHYQENITLSRLSKTFNLNPTYISRFFKQHVGQNFTDYLHSLRIERAVILLEVTAMSIIDISYEVGFSHSRTFSRVFKELKGVSPRMYRAKRKNNGT